jgi:broad specificity phosphatase PhoE
MLAPGVTLYFVRHGETDWNLAQRYQGQQDVALNATGRRQAARNGRMLAEALGSEVVGFAYVASPLLRARQTMEILRGELGLPADAYLTDARLAEINYGHWEGQLWSELPHSDPDGFAARQADMWNWRPRGGESYRALSLRVGGWLRSIERDTIVVAHGGVMRVLRGHIERLDPAAMFALPVPQDRVLILADGSSAWL